MGDGLRLVKNIIALWTPNILNPAISFALILFISRYLGVEGLGAYSLVVSYLGIFMTLAALGLGTLVVREAARDLEQAHVFFVNAALFGFVSSVVAIVGMIVVVGIMGYENEVFQAAVICSFSLFASTAINYMEGMFRAFERAEYIAITFLAENILRVGSCVILLLYGYGIVPLFIAFLGSRFFAGALMFFCYVKVAGNARIPVQARSVEISWERGGHLRQHRNVFHHTPERRSNNVVQTEESRIGGDLQRGR